LKVKVETLPILVRHLVQDALFFLIVGVVHQGYSRRLQSSRNDLFDLGRGDLNGLCLPILVSRQSPLGLHVRLETLAICSFHGSVKSSVKVRVCCPAESSNMLPSHTLL
jgi:hypothetical protein